MKFTATLQSKGAKKKTTASSLAAPSTTSSHVSLPSAVVSQLHSGRHDWARLSSAVIPHLNATDAVVSVQAVLMDGDRREQLGQAFVVSGRK